MKGDLEGRGEMSAPLGELTIFRLEYGDEATYRCEFSNYPYQKVNLSVYGKYLFCFDVQGWSKGIEFFSFIFLKRIVYFY